MDAAVLMQAHSGLRWLLIAAALVALLVTLRSLRGGMGLADRVVMLVFRIVFIIQWLAGLVLLLVQSAASGWPLYRLEHALTMTVAVGITHVFGGRRAARPLVNLLVILVSMGLVVFSITRLPQGWRLAPPT